MSVFSFAQNSQKKWYFGDAAGLDFMTSPPTILTNSSMTVSGSYPGASIADGSGNLLFYTNGTNIWNQLHIPMPNTLLGGNPIIVKKPGANSIYYLFVASNSLLNYSTVDMSLFAGLGGLQLQSVPVYSGAITMEIAAVTHCNGSDAWIVIHQQNSANFRSYLLTAAGLSTVAVISSVGPSDTSNSYHRLKFSPNGKKMARARGGNGYQMQDFQLYDFDNASGIISNFLSLGQGPITYGNVFGVAFSPDGTKLYGTKQTAPAIYQWNLCAGSNAAIIGSLVSVSLTAINIITGDIELAPNGKIYAAVSNTHLAVINNPNALGTGCGLVLNGQSINPRFNGQQINNSMTIINSTTLAPFTFTMGNTLGCNTASFTGVPIQNMVSSYCSVSSTLAPSYLWNFGDPASGAANTSTLINPSHVYSGAGTYTAQLLFYSMCGPSVDTLKQIFTINSPSLTVSTTSINCANLGTGTVITSGGVGPFSYTWMPTNQTTTVVSGLVPGNYTLTVFDAGLNCSLSNTLNFLPLIPLTGSLIATPSLQCGGVNNGTAAIINLAGGSGNTQYNWTNGSITFTAATLNTLSAGSWTVYVSDALTACNFNNAFVVTQPPVLTLNTSANSPSTCVGENIIFTSTIGGGTPGFNYSWSAGPSSDTLVVNEITGGTYIYTLNVLDSLNCLISNTIAVDFIPNPVLTVLNASICPLAVGTLTALGASSYLWSDNTTNSTFTASPLVNTQYTVIGSALGCTSVAYPTIILYPIPTPIFTSNSPRCNGQNLQLNASGGVLFNFDGPQSFVSNLQSPVINAATPLYSGVYNLTITSVNGCTASTSQTLAVNPTPSLSVVGATVCTSQTLNLNASSVAGATYLWNGAQNFTSTLQNPFINNPSVLASGNYSIKVLSPQNCSNTSVVYVSVIPPPSLTSNLNGNGTLCAQAFNGSPNSITLTAGGAATYTLATPQHILNNNPSGPLCPLSTLPPFTAGLATATLTGSNGVCTAIKTVTFSVIPNPSLTVTSPTPVICVGKTFTYTSSGANSYTWGPGTPGLSTYTGPVTIASPTVTSVYSVVGGSLGCNSGTQTSTITVNPLPTVSITPNNPSICLGDKIKLTALGNGTSFDWSPNLALNTNTGAIVSAGPVTQQTYQVMASLNSCTQIAMVTVSIIALPIPQITLPKSRLCVNDVITLIGKGGDTYNWTAPNNLLYAGQTVSFVAHSLNYGGTYILNVIDGNNCKNKTTADLIVDDLPYGSLIPSSKYNCVPFTSEFVFDSHTKPTTYWTLENSSYTGNKFSHLFTVPGEYLITGHLQDTNTNCLNTLTISVNAYPVLKADFKFLPEKPVENLETVIFTNNSTGDFQTKWNWFFIANNGFKSSNENTSYFFQDAGLYPVAFIVQNKYGCSDTIVKTIKVESDFNIYVPNAFTPNGDELNDIFLPILRGTKFYSLSIFDRWGAKLFETNSTESGWDGTYKGEEAKQDVYVWKITVSSNSGEQKTLTGQVTLTR